MTVEVRKGYVTAFEVMPCMCGGSRCDYCSYHAKHTCEQSLTHCPKCGHPYEKAVNDKEAL